VFAAKLPASLKRVKISRANNLNFSSLLHAGMPNLLDVDLQNNDGTFAEDDVKALPAGAMLRLNGTRLDCHHCKVVNVLLLLLMLLFYYVLLIVFLVVVVGGGGDIVTVVLCYTDSVCCCCCCCCCCCWHPICFFS
jgi:hypothetical protein